MRTNVINIKNHAVMFHYFSQIEIKYCCNYLQKEEIFLKKVLFLVCIVIDLAVCVK